jgi:hypothetical protein
MYGEELSCDLISAKSTPRGVLLELQIDGDDFVELHYRQSSAGLIWLARPRPLLARGIIFSHHLP